MSLAAAEAEGATVRLHDGPTLASAPHYSPGAAACSPEARRLVDDMRRADGLIMASPGYHGCMSGLVKNAMDYLEETARDGRVYLDGVPVGLIETAHGWQATGSTLGTMRSIVHAMRGWPTPLGAAIKSAVGLFVDGRCTDPAIAGQLALVGRQVVEFARLHCRVPNDA